MRFAHTARNCDCLHLEILPFGCPSQLSATLLPLTVWPVAAAGHNHYSYELQPALERLAVLGCWLVRELNGRSMLQLTEKHQVKFVVLARNNAFEREVFESRIYTA